MKKDKYKLIKEESIKNIIEFLDEIQFEAAKLNTTDAHHQVNFCNWAINELLNSYNVMTLKDSKKSKGDSKKPNKKSRDQYVDETFMDWNLPEMTDEEYEKLVDQFDAFLRGWEKEYFKKNGKSKKQSNSKESIQDKNWKPHIDDVIEHCSLDEVKEFLKDDPELTDEERFELYYDERERRKPENKGLSYEDLFKGTGVTPPKKK